MDDASKKELQGYGAACCATSVFYVIGAAVLVFVVVWGLWHFLVGG